MILTKEILKKAIPDLSQLNLDKYYNPIAIISANYGIDTPLRLSHFLAQIGHESQSFLRYRENLNYSSEGLLKTFPKYFNAKSANEYAHNPIKIANKVYANRMGNGNELSGDGWKYCGRGCIQITGKDNYRECSLFLFGDSRLLSFPEMLELPENGIKAACWFWIKNNINIYADRDDVFMVRKKVNGGKNGIDDVIKRLSLAKKALGI